VIIKCQTKKEEILKPMASILLIFRYDT